MATSASAGNTALVQHAVAGPSNVSLILIHVHFMSNHISSQGVLVHARMLCKASAVAGPRVAN